MNLSWFDSANAQLATDLIESETLISSVSTYKNMWIRNNGVEYSNTGLIDFGFYITATALDDLNRLLMLAQLSDEDDLPYGLFVVFGQIEGSSAIDLFLGNSLTKEELLNFQVNWNQGSSPLNKIRIKNVDTYLGNNVYSKTSTFPIYASLTENNIYENQGKMKVCLGMRLPEGYTLVGNFELNAHASNQDEA